MQPTLSEMLSILVDTVMASELGIMADAVRDIATEIRDVHGSTTYTQSLIGLDPFQASHPLARDLQQRGCGACAPLAQTGMLLALTATGRTMFGNVRSDVDRALATLEGC